MALFARIDEILREAENVKIWRYGGATASIM